MSAVAITAAASGQLGTTGASAGASGGKKDATTAGKYYEALAVFRAILSDLKKERGFAAT